jgi:hypothetical protein
MGVSFDPADIDRRRAEIAGFEPVWHAVEAAVFAAYERLSGRRFRHQSYPCHVASAMALSGYTSPLRGMPPLICIRSAPAEQWTTTVVHELAHALAIDNPAWHLRIAARIWLRHRTREFSRVTSHALINFLHQEAARAALPDADSALAMARAWRGLQDAWALVDRDEAWLRRLIVRDRVPAA